MARTLRLLERVPELFRRRGWVALERCCIVTAAVACVRLGRGRTEFRIPAAPDDPPCWMEIVGRRVSATEIVAKLDLGELLRIRELSMKLAR